MNSVIRTSFLLVATLFSGILLTGCGGGSSESASYQGDTHSAVLSWNAPLTRVNGDSIPMGELDRYVIRYGRDKGDLTQEVVVTNAQVEPQMSYEISGLDVGTWYFTIQVQDTSGLISEPSEVVSKSIRS